MSYDPPPPPPPPPPFFSGKRGDNPITTRFLLRKWWHDVLRNYGRFSCYATFLALPSNKEAVQYLNEYGKELHLMADDNCLILAFSESLEMNSGYDEKLWRAIVSEHVDEGYSIKFAQHFDIEISKFPCLVVFDDIRSSNHILINLKGINTEEIAERMRIVFSLIDKSKASKTNPLHEMKNHQVKEGYSQKGKIIFGELRSFAGKTIETAVEALINASVK